MSRPKPAQVADYDSDESRIVSGTEVSAQASSKRRTQEQPSSSRAPKQAERTSQSGAPKKAASDSGYSSAPLAGTKAPPAAVASAPTSKVAHSTSQKAATSSPAKSKPIIHRQDSARSTTRAATISNTTAKRDQKCPDPNCREPNCESSRNTERRYTISNPNRISMPPPPPPPPQAQAQYQYQPQYDYAAMPPPSAIPLSRRQSIGRPRPHSIHVPHVPASIPMTYPPAHPGATPGYGYGYGQGSYGPQQAVYENSSPSQPTAYSQPSPVKPAVASSPLTSTYPNFPGQIGKISARTGNPAVPGLVTSIPMSAPAPAYNVSASGMSAREKRRSVQYPEQQRSRDDGYTSSESESSEDDRHQDHQDSQGRRRESTAIDHERHRSKSRRRQSVVVEDPRRPANRKSYTTSAVPTRQSSRKESSSRPESFNRTASDPLADNLSSSEHYDSGTTSKAVLDRRERDRRDAAKRHSRRLSVSTAGDSYSTPPTSISNDTNRIEAVVEDRYGRRKVYLSREEYAELSRKHEREDRELQRDRLEEQRMQRERIERYQQEWDQTAGVERQHLTATNIKQASRSSKSQVSGRSHKSTTSGSKLSTRGGLTLESGGTMLYLEEGIQAISLKVDDDGGMRVVIPSGSGREQSYHGSKSSGSRVGRSKTVRERSIREEQQYEPAL